jgi:ribosome-associated protein
VTDVLEASELVDRIAAVASDKKAIDIRVLDVREIVGYTDFFMICSGNTDRQARAIYEGIYEELKRDGVLPRRVEGERQASWILMDYLDCVVHIFTPDARSYYRL